MFLVGALSERMTFLLEFWKQESINYYSKFNFFFSCSLKEFTVIGCLNDAVVIYKWPLLRSVSRLQANVCNRNFATLPCSVLHMNRGFCFRYVGAVFKSQTTSCFSFFFNDTLKFSCFVISVKSGRMGQRDGCNRREP